MPYLFATSSHSHEPWSINARITYFQSLYTITFFKTVTQNLWENICAGILFSVKLQAVRQNLTKNQTLNQQKLHIQNGQIQVLLIWEMLMTSTPLIYHETFRNLCSCCTLAKAEIAKWKSRKTSTNRFHYDSCNFFQWRHSKMIIRP